MDIDILLRDGKVFCITWNFSRSMMIRWFSDEFRKQRKLFRNWLIITNSQKLWSRDLAVGLLKGRIDEKHVHFSGDLESLRIGYLDLELGLLQCQNCHEGEIMKYGDDHEFREVPTLSKNCYCGSELETYQA